MSDLLKEVAEVLRAESSNATTSVCASLLRMADMLDAKAKELAPRNGDAKVFVQSYVPPVVPEKNYAEFSRMVSELKADADTKAATDTDDLET